MIADAGQKPISLTRIHYAVVHSAFPDTSAERAPIATNTSSSNQNCVFFPVSELHSVLFYTIGKLAVFALVVHVRVAIFVPGNLGRVSKRLL